MDWSNRLKKIQDEELIEQSIPRMGLAEVLPKLSKVISCAGAADNHSPAACSSDDWQPEPRAWIENGELRTQGVFPGDWPDGGLTPEIIKLTADDLPLQRRLLKLHCGVYQGPWWGRLVERWEERTAIMHIDGGLPLEEAEVKAAECLRASAFLDELRHQAQGKSRRSSFEQQPIHK